MCIIGCAPKLKLNDLYRAISDGIVDLDTYANKGVYKIQQIKLTFDELENIIIVDSDNWKENVQKFIHEKIKIINMNVPEYIYQGCIVYAKGNPRKKLIGKLITAINFGVYHGRHDIIDPHTKSLRPTELTLFSENETEIDIRLLFVFSHESKIRSYMYQRDDWIHRLNPQSTKQYLKHNKNKNNEFWDEGINVLILDTEDNNFDDKFKKKFKINTKGFDPKVILCKNEKMSKILFENQDDLKLNKWIVGV